MLLLSLRVANAWPHNSFRRCVVANIFLELLRIISCHCREDGARNVHVLLKPASDFIHSDLSTVASQNDLSDERQPLVHSEVGICQLLEVVCRLEVSTSYDNTNYDSRATKCMHTTIR